MPSAVCHLRCWRPREDAPRGRQALLGVPRLWLLSVKVTEVPPGAEWSRAAPRVSGLGALAPVLTSAQARAKTEEWCSVGRFRSLDGLRGIAAFVVLIHHTLLIFPPVVEPYVDNVRAADGWPSVLMYTPVHLLWDGQAAVYIFFVLSGFVVALPVIRRRANFSWLTYYPQRLARLYLPVWAAVAFTVGLILFIDRNTPIGNSWLDASAGFVSKRDLFLDLTLIVGDGELMSQLWTLRWEVIFSILLPLYVWIAIRFNRHWLAIATASLGLIVAGQFGLGSYASILPMFMLGVLLAVRLPEVSEFSARLNRGQRAWIVAGTLLLMSSPWMLTGLGATGSLVGVSRVAAIVAATVSVWIALTVPAASRVLSSRGMQWLGTISFSLYLVHEPIVISSAFFFGEDQLVIAAVVAITLSLGVAVAFYHLIERPSHLFARWLGQAVQEKFGSKVA